MLFAIFFFHCCFIFRSITFKELKLFIQNTMDFNDDDGKKLLKYLQQLWNQAKEIVGKKNSFYLL